MALIEKLNAIGDAIRSKTGKGDKLTLAQMVTEIEGIEVGGNDSAAQDIEQVWNGEIVDLAFNIDTIPAYGCYKGRMKTITINSNDISIGYYAFQYSTLLEEVIVNSVSGEVGGSIFSGCTSLKSITWLHESLDQNQNVSDVFCACSALTDVNIPNLSKIGRGWFKDCSSLEKLDTYARHINDNAFLRSAIDTFITRKTDAVATLTSINAFQGTPIESGTGYIYVPKALIEDYKVATNWINFAEQFRAIEDYPEICGGAEND